MEPAQGVTLKERLGSGPLPLSDALDYVTQALSALGDAHARGVVYRNISPANLVVAAGGAAKLRDAGGDAAASESRCLAPEQVEGREPDARSNLFSVGMVLQDLIAGAQPLPAGLGEIIQIATAREPEKRFQSAAAFRAAIESVRAVVPSPVAAVAPAQVPRARSGHRGLYVALGVVLLLAVVVAGAMYAPGWLKPRTTESPAAVQQETPTIPSEQPPEVQQPAPVPPPPEQPPALSEQPAAARPAGRPQQAAREIPAPPARLPQQAEPSQPAPAQPVDLARAAALRELQKEWPMLASRAGTVTTRLRDLEQEQRRSGYGLRADVASSWKRLEHYMDQAEDALSAKDPDAARTNMDGAERELATLEKFLGR